jgi:thiamine kinase-like enzyme
MDETIDFHSLACEALGVDVQIVDQPKRLSARPSAERWAVTTSRGSIVVRISRPHPADAYMNRDSEPAILTVVAAHGLAPKALFVDTARGILVTESSPGKLWGPRDARSPRNIARIASLLRRLHALDIPPQVVPLDIHRILSSYWNSLMEQGRATQAGTAKTRDRIKRLAENLSTSRPRSICHTAIFHGNIMDNGDIDDTTANGLTLVDWEFACVGDPILDLAGLCCHHAFSPELRAALLRHYMGSDDAAAAFKRLDNACLLVSYIRELWFTAREV